MRAISVLAELGEDARARIALSGTPGGNRLGDLWSIFDFLNPGLLARLTAAGRTTSCSLAVAHRRENRRRPVSKSRALPSNSQPAWLTGCRTCQVCPQAEQQTAPRSEKSR
jgi:hypothetical protein